MTISRLLDTTSPRTKSLFLSVQGPLSGGGCFRVRVGLAGKAGPANDLHAIAADGASVIIENRQKIPVTSETGGPAVGVARRVPAGGEHTLHAGG